MRYFVSFLKRHMSETETGTADHPKNIGTGVLYPAKSDIDELIAIFNGWLTGEEPEDHEAFIMLLERLEANPLYYQLPWAMRIMDRMLQDQARDLQAVEDEIITEYVDEEEKALEKDLARTKGEMSYIMKVVKPYTIEFLQEMKHAAKKKSKSLQKQYKSKLKDLRKEKTRAEDKYGEDSVKYRTAQRAYNDVKSLIKIPMREYEMREYEIMHGQYREHIEHRVKQLQDLETKADRIQKQLDYVRKNHDARHDAQRVMRFDRIKQSFYNDFMRAWSEAFEILGTSMRWNEAIIKRFREPKSINKKTFVEDFNAAMRMTYATDTLRNNVDQATDNYNRELLRGHADHAARSVYIEPTTLVPQDPKKLDQVESLVAAAEAAVKIFSDIEAFQLLTQIDFMPQSESYAKPSRTGQPTRVFAPRRLRIPRIGYFQFNIRAKEFYQIYEAYLAKFEPVTDYHRRAMIEALVSLSKAIRANDQKVLSVNDVTKIVMIADQVFKSHEALSVNAFQDAINIAISQLEHEEPDIDSYVKAYMQEEKTIGSDPSSLDDVRCSFYNPFECAPVYYFFGVAGAAHKAVNKAHLWLWLMNTKCDDMDCIPSALAIKKIGLVTVPPVQVEAVRAMLKTMSAAELASGSIAYHQIMGSVTDPWIMVRGVSQLGDWKIFEASSADLFTMTPSEYRLKMDKIIGLHQDKGHITRITDFVDYDGTGWSYKVQDFVVIADVCTDSGVGNSLIKLLRGNAKLFDSGACCIGEKTYAELVAYRQSHLTTEVLDHLTCPDMIPVLVHDSLEMAEVSGMQLGPGEINGERYDSVPITKLNEKDCVDKALADTSFEVWDMLRMPRWIIVTGLDKEAESWTVERASDSTLLSITPLEAAQRQSNLIVFLRKGVPAKVDKLGPGLAMTKKSSALHRVLDYFIKVPSEDDSNDMYSGRYNLVVMCNSQGILDSIDVRRPKAKSKDGDDDEDSEDLISNEEMMNARAEDTIENQLACFKKARYIAVNDLKLSRNGRIKSFNVVVSQGKVSPDELLNGATDLLRLWIDPNRQAWLIVASKWYTMKEDMYKDMPITYIGADYETLNKGNDTNGVLLSWARIDYGSSEVSKSGCFKGIQCTRQFVNFIAELVVKEHRRVIVTTFHGAYFDLHMMLEGIASWGNFGQQQSDMIIIVGNKILQINWLKMVKFVDLRRFTQNSLAGVCEAFHVKNPKSKIDLALVQSIYERCNCNLESFWIELNKLSSDALTRDVASDSKWPEFQSKIAHMNGEQVYVEYCINDSVATVECYMKLRQACSGMVKGMSLPTELSEEFLEKYDVDKYCTIPAMAYHCYRAGLPITSDGEKIIPPVAENLLIHTYCKKSGIGGRSQIPLYGMSSGMLTEAHEVYDVASLFPSAALYGHMPAGELTAVTQIGEPISLDLVEASGTNIQRLQLPVPNKLGFYMCTIMSQPEYPVIPREKAGHSLNWNYRQPFSRWIHVVTMREHIFLGGTIVAHYGYVWSGMNDHYFDNSLRLWKTGKMRQDVLKNMLPMLSDDDTNLDLTAFMVMLDNKDPKVSWAFTDGVRDEKKIEEVLEAYNPIVRWLYKMLSNSLLGRTGKKLKTSQTLIMNGSASVVEFLEDHQKDKFVLHKLSKSPDSNPSVMTQITAPFSKCSMITLDINQNDLFNHKKDSLKVPEAGISTTMLAYSHFHMGISMNRFDKAKAWRGHECDGIHCNPVQYVAWCEANGILNPFWIDSPLKHIKAKSVLDDDIFKPIPGDARSADEITRLGSFYCPTAANRYAMAHSLPQVSKVIDYGCYTEELKSPGLFDVFYPFCKFYYFKSLSTGKEVIKAKGLSAKESSPTRDGHNYILLENSKEYKEAGDGSANKTLAQMKMLQACFNESPPLVNRDMFIKLSQGFGVDAIDYRFQGRLSKINGIHVDTAILIPETDKIPTPIHYTLCTKRIEPPKVFRASAKNGKLYCRGVEITETSIIKNEIVRAVRDNDPIAKRGFTVMLSSGAVYISNDLFRKVFRTLKQIGKEWQSRVSAKVKSC